MSVPRALLIPLIAVLATMEPALAAPPDGGTVRVFILAGQSNAEGADTDASEVDLLPPYVGAADVQPDVRFWYETNFQPLTSGHWIALQPELQRDIFGPELTFASRVKGAISDPIAIIKSTRGGSTLAVDWEPGNTDGFELYERTLTLVQTALAELTTEGVTWQLEGVLWQQGENDMLDDQYVAEYGANLTGLIAQLRADLGEPDLPWHIGATSDKCVWGMDFRDNMQTLRSQQLAVVAADPLVHFVPSSHLAFQLYEPDMAPDYHFGNEGILQLGEAFGDSYLASIGVDVSHESEPFCCGFPAPPGSRVRVFVLAGQRSMEGERAYVQEIADYPEFAALSAPQHGVAYRYRLGGDSHVSTDWAPLGPADYLDNFGPELSFGQAMASESDDPVALIKITHSAAVLSDWVPSPTDASLPQYEAAIAFIQDALADLQGQGFDPELEAVVWLPGEHDAWWNPFLQAYAPKFTTLVAAMRADLAAPDLRWLVAELPDGLIWETSKLNQLDAKIQSVTGADPQMWFVGTNAIAVPPTSPTFGTEGTLELGKLLAEFYLGLPWLDLGGGTSGANGPVSLVGEGSLVGGTPATLSLTNAPPSAPLLAWISFAPTPFAALGGTVHAFPFASQLFFSADGTGAFSATTSWPPGVAPDTKAWFQFLVEDPTTVHGITLSNGLRATTP